MTKINLKPKKYSEHWQEFIDLSKDGNAWDEWWDKIINLEDISETLDSISNKRNKKIWMDILSVRNCWKTNKAKMDFEKMAKSYLKKKDSTKFNKIKNHLKKHPGISNYYMSIFKNKLKTKLLEEQGLNGKPPGGDTLKVSIILEYISNYSQKEISNELIKETGQKLIKDRDLAFVLENAFKGIDTHLTNKYLDAMDKVIEKQRLLNDVMDGDSDKDILLFDKICDIVYDLPDLYPLLFNFEELIYKILNSKRKSQTKSNLFKFISLKTGGRKSVSAIKVYYYDKYPSI